MNTFIIFNANIVTPNRVINEGSVLVQDGIITDISSENLTKNYPGAQTFDARCNYLVPGIIDIHTDAMDYEINPRPSADFPIHVAFSELEKRMCSAGITTVFHSLHLGYRDAENSARTKYKREEIFDEVYKASQKAGLIHNYIHLRFEITGVDDFQLCYDLIDKGMVRMFSFMDHTPGQGQYQQDKYMAIAKQRGLSEEKAIEEFYRRMSRPKITNEQMEHLIAYLKMNNIPIASHDDDNPQIVALNHARGINICEFPINMETAKMATTLGMHVVGGAANILRGGSTGGNLNVYDAIEKGFVNAICSDYFPPSILYSIFMLYEKGVMTLPGAVNLASLNPAMAAGIGELTGSIENGKLADFLLIKYHNEVPVIVNTIVAGNISATYQSRLQPVYELSN